MQAFVVSSPDIESESDPTKITWSTMPQGDTGLRAMQNDLAEEGDVVQLGGGADLLYFFRTFDGYVGQASYLRGSWKDKMRARRLLDGSSLKNPNGPIAPRRFVGEEGDVYYLLLFYNRGLPSTKEEGNRTKQPNAAWGDRNPYWLASG